MKPNIIMLIKSKYNFSIDIELIFKVRGVCILKVLEL